MKKAVKIFTAFFILFEWFEACRLLEPGIGIQGHGESNPGCQDENLMS